MSDIANAIYRHLRTMAPHQLERLTAIQLREAAAEIERLRLTHAEREAIEWAVATTAWKYDEPTGPINRERLRGLLERTQEDR